MPAIGNASNLNFKPPAPPKTAPPPTSLTTGNNPRGVAIAGPAPKGLAITAPRVSLPHGAGSMSYAGRAVAQPASAYRNPQSYEQTVMQVFKGQPKAQQQAMLQGAQKNPNIPESKAILKYAALTGGYNVPLASVTSHSPSLAALEQGAGGVTGYLAKLLVNSAKDVYQMPMNTVQGAYSVGKDIVTGHEGNAFNALVDPYIHLAEHPISTFTNNPVNVAMMLAGPKAALGRVAGAATRSGLLGDSVAQATSLAREPLSVGTVAGEASPIAEHRYYSTDLFSQALQKARESYLKFKGQNPNISRPVPSIRGQEMMPQSMQYAFNVGMKAKLQRFADEMTSTRQAAGRAERAAALNAMKKAAPSKEAKNVVSHVLQGVVRHPDTAVEDTVKEINRLKAAQADLRPRSLDMHMNRMQVRDLSNALATPADASGLPSALNEAFQTASHVRPTLQAQDILSVQKGLLEPEQAMRAKLFPYAQAHMGARYDPATDRLVGPDGQTLTTQAILDHAEGWRNIATPNPARAEAQGARAEAFVSHGRAQFEHMKAADEHRAAQAERAAAQGEFNAHASGAPTPKEERMIRLVTALRDRPGTPGEGAAAQARLNAILAKIAARTGGISRDRLTAAEQRVQEAIRGKALTRRNLDQASANLAEKEAALRNTPATTTMRVHSGVETPTPAYVGHFPEKTSPFRFYSAYRLARGTYGKGRKGTAFERGGYDHTWEGLAGQIASRAEAVTKATLHDRVINELGIKPTREMFRRASLKYHEGLLTKQEANALARAALVDDRGNPIQNATELTPISASPISTLQSVKNLQHPNELNNISGIETHALVQALRDAQHDTARNNVLIPTEAARRFEQQFARSDAGLRKIGRVTQQFRRTVLPYSTHWMTQIGSEAVIRGLVAGVLHPGYLADGRKLMHQLENTPEGRQALMEMVNANFFNQHSNLYVHNPNPGMVTTAAHAFPPTRAIIAAHNHYADFIGTAMYRLEHTFRLMGLGKMAHREVASWGNAWQNAVKIQGKNMAVLAEKLKADPQLVTHFGRQIDNIFGKYNKFTPMQRTAIQSVAPFLPWYLNAAKFVLWHLPKDHPVSSALLASLRQTVNQDIQDGKQTPLNVYGMQELARISPWGIFTPPSTTPNVAGVAQGVSPMVGAVLPQLEGSLFNYFGQSSFGGSPLTTTPDKSAKYGSAAYKGDVAPQSSQAVMSALNNLLESFMPAARYAREAREGGGPAYGASTLISPKPKPGNPGKAGSVVNRMFNPFYSFEEAQKSKASPKYESAKKQAADKAAASSGAGSWNFGGAASGGGSSGGWNFGGSSGGSSGGGGWNFGG